MSEWNTLPSDQVLEETKKNLEDHGFKVVIISNKNEALNQLKTEIPQGSQVMAGSSTTLDEIGYSELVTSAESPWQNLQAEVWSENDAEKRDLKRRQAATAEYFLSSVNAIAKTGELVAVDATGSRVTALPYAAKHVVLVVGANKVVNTLEAAMQRIRDHVFPLENVRAQKAYGTPSVIAKWVILERETTPHRTTVILVKEQLGF